MHPPSGMSSNPNSRAELSEPLTVVLPIPWTQHPGTREGGRRHERRADPRRRSQMSHRCNAVLERVEWISDAPQKTQVIQSIGSLPAGTHPNRCPRPAVAREAFGRPTSDPPPRRERLAKVTTSSHPLHILSPTPPGSDSDSWEMAEPSPNGAMAVQADDEVGMGTSPGGVQTVPSLPCAQTLDARTPQLRTTHRPDLPLPFSSFVTHAVPLHVVPTHRGPTDEEDLDKVDLSASQDWAHGLSKFQKVGA